MENNYLPDKLTPQEQEMVNVFIGQNFKPLTTTFIAERLKINENTLIQRLRRDNGLIFETTNNKPKLVSIKQNIRKVTLFSTRYQCALCQKSKKDPELKIIKRFPGIESENYDNLITVCVECLEKKKTPPTGKAVLLSDFKLDRDNENMNHHGWEYKQMIVKRQEYTPPQELYPTFYYYAFQDVESTKEWCYIAKDGLYPENILSKSVGVILNAFGKAGWELIKLEYDLDENDSIIGDWGIAGYELIFKREIFEK